MSTSIYKSVISPVETHIRSSKFGNIRIVVRQTPRMTDVYLQPMTITTKAQLSELIAGLKMIEESATWPQE